LLPDYSLVPNWKSSIIFSSRGCIRKCGFCAVPRLEPKFSARQTIQHLIYPGHKKVIFWDNNILASSHWRDIFREVRELDLRVDFNHGIDARLINEEVAEEISKLQSNYIRLAYDMHSVRDSVESAITNLKEVGIRGRGIIVYTLYNYKDSPEDFLSRIRDLIEWGVASYPMRYEPIDSLKKNSYVAPKWTPELLEMIADARRVLGYAGAFPPYEGLKKKILNADGFMEAFKLRPLKITQVSSNARRA